MNKEKVCKTVGQLIKELSKLPKNEKLDEPLIVVHYNVYETAKELGLKPCVGFERG